MNAINLPRASTWTRALARRKISPHSMMRNLTDSVNTGRRLKRKHIKKVIEETSGVLHRIPPRQLSVIVRALVSIDYSPSPSWLEELDEAVWNSHRTTDSTSLCQILASLFIFRQSTTAQPPSDVGLLRLPSKAYLKLIQSPQMFDSYQQLSVLLHCLTKETVGSIFDESEFLDAIGSRMGVVLASMEDPEAREAIQTSLCKSQSLFEILGDRHSQFCALITQSYDDI